MVLGLLNIVYFVMYAILYPYLPILIRGLGYTPVAVGLLMGLFDGAGIAGPLIIGSLADKWGMYKRPLVISVLLTVLPVMPLVLIRNPLVSAVFIIIIAIGLRSYQPLLDAITTIYVGPGGNYGRIRVSGSIAYVLAMLFYQVTPFFYPDSAFNIGVWTIIGGVICLGVTAAVFNDADFRDRGDPEQSAGKLSPAKAAAAKGAARSFGKRWSQVFVLGIIMIALSRFNYAPVNFLGLYVTEALQWNAVGIIFSLAAITEIPIMFLARRLILRFGSLPLLAFGALCTGIRMLLYAVFPGPGGVVAGQLLHFASYGIFHNAAVAFVSVNVPPDKRALGMTVYLSLGTGLPTFIGNILAGFIIEEAGWKNLFILYGASSVLPLMLFVFISRSAFKPSNLKSRL
ncbi:MAG: MFS transporter [Spirochaetaceae bacterium]|jgi:PPP family 3-phenylpropionic acid transporter|nr:MFS transporter [Spirochaetaceae bacterium]